MAFQKVQYQTYKNDDKIFQFKITLLGNWKEIKFLHIHLIFTTY